MASIGDPIRPKPLVVRRTLSRLFSDFHDESTSENVLSYRQQGFFTVLHRKSIRGSIQWIRFWSGSDSLGSTLSLRSSADPSKTNSTAELNTTSETCRASQTPDGDQLFRERIRSVFVYKVFSLAENLSIGYQSHSNKRLV